MAIIFDPILGKIRKKDIIPQLTSDPASPKPESSWVLKTLGAGGGELKAMFGMGLPILSQASGSASYQLSYRTKEGTTLRVALT